MKNINDFVSELSNKVSVVEKFDFERVNAVFDALHFAFYPDGPDDDNFDDRCLALWTLFLNAAGWTEDEYWSYWKEHKDEFCCPKCKEEKAANLAAVEPNSNLSEIDKKAN